MQTVGATARGKATRKPLKLEKFDGTSTPLQTFLRKYQNCAKYNDWDADERVAFLRDRLHGNASQVLWEISDDADDKEIIRLLRNRSGDSNQMERFRAELNGRRRGKGESIQSVYQDIRRLLSSSLGKAGSCMNVSGTMRFSIVWETFPYV